MIGVATFFVIGLRRVDGRSFKLHIFIDYSTFSFLQPAQKRCLMMKTFLCTLALGLCGLAIYNLPPAAPSVRRQPDAKVLRT
jgi:hypothetical protein